MSHHTPIKRRPTKKIYVGNVAIGGDAPISVQSMTNTDTCDVAATVAQIQRCVDAGADLMRVSTPTMESVKAFGEIKKQVSVPLIADIHFDYKIALAVAEAGADCLRINPGNIGSDAKVREVVACARHHNVPIRIGVNAGSLEKDLQKKYGEPTGEAMLESALRHIDILEKLNFQNYKISVKASNVFLTLDAYRLISAQIDNPLHLGVTEAGVYRTGTVKSAIALGGLLLDGIGDTMRISLASPPEEEIKIGFDILKSLNIRANGVNFIACPSCSRQEFDVIKVMNELEARLEDVREPMDLSVIGCKVNGPGEAKEATIGVVGASPNSLVYKMGQKSHLIDTKNLVDEIEQMVREKAKELAAAREIAKQKEIIRVG
ncbi:4-hydroxy-3-methylbut-2-en-1-yl diphosphate synthase [Moraxella caviae]|uniref:4-hydroxy-3-methylbut-2-en-1-yl diphosphate synthase (flavodoxin) n=1 Tax=Moraxella caviae TaxID=34060 RepID=A0A1T0A6I2_9GAMM|nr:flavodoxin-dependent (E)-4-hydroxy-3-methylbut-2-enyl-diphosphate synthase [Moraxella caviae]OOR91188.1 4-hydroxy-3-methylbut-2-en-1-yl diphosphate synthase [Moraxella caviae]STZ13775.1 4-hydroxy-3-methylbut-2-en-1-yl diphosphate synthase [Moraxella caviae]VEW12656.1 4-hydroxy-3-methylbut-2-en-1-yl diphosphate synthase [Moraxella caviae]